jgi:hypothetical protein
MAQCKFVAPNGNKSNLYDKIYSQFGSKTAIKGWATTRTQEFKNWYDGEKDANGEPVLNELNEFVNKNGDIRNLSDILEDYISQTTTLEAFSKQVEDLTDIFTNQGLNIEVKLNSDANDIGSVVTINGTTTLEFNPRKIKSDSAFHEFGHIYVDMLGEHKHVTRGIELLKDTPLWNKVKNLYPNLSEDRLGKEVLTTAIGIEAAKEFAVRAKLRDLRGQGLLSNLKNIVTWVQHFFKLIADKLGIGMTPARRLAYDLVSGNLRYTLTSKPASYKQQQKSKLTVEELQKMSKEMIKLSEDERNYVIDNDENRKLDRVTTVIDNLKDKFDRQAAIEKSLKSKNERHDFFKTKEDVETLWADTREEGTVIHGIFEDYIAQRNAGKSREEARKYVLDNLRDAPVGTDAEGIRFYSGAKKELVEGYVDNLLDFTDTLFAKGYKLYPEVKIFDEELGVAGTIDLLIEKPNGEYMIYDFKTKQKGKFDKFYSVYDKQKRYLHEAFDKTQVNKATDYALQLSTYALMLERKGFKVTKLAIIPITGTVVEEDGEYRYTDMSLDDNEYIDSDGVLPLKNFTQELETVYLDKDDVEKIIEEATETEETLDDLFTRASELNNISKNLENIILNLKRSISRMRATAAPEKAAQFESQVSTLIKKLMVEDEMMAVTSYTNFLTNGVASLLARFQDRVVSKKNPDGTEIEVVEKGYDNLTWHSIKQLEIENPQGYYEFLGFLINADMFIEQAMQIKDIPMSDAATHNIVLKNLKALEGHISDLKLKVKRLNVELDYRYAELSSNPLYGERGVLNATHDFFKAQPDETFMQANFDALADSHNRYMANVMRLYDYKMRTMKDEQKEELENWEDAVAKFTKATGKSLDIFVEKESGRIVPRIDYRGYYEARSKAFEEAHALNKVQKRKFLSKWFANNSRPLTQEERKALIKQKKRELDSTSFREWMQRNTYKDRNGRTKDNKSGVFFKPKEEVWETERYKSYDEASREMHTYLTNLMGYLTAHTKSSIVKDGYLPAIPKNDKGFMEQLIGNLGWRDKGVYDSELGVIENENGEIVNFLPFRFNNLLAQQKYHVITKDMDEAVKSDLREKNAEIRKNNKAAHATAINQNLAEVIPAYIREAVKHKHKKSMEFELLRVKKSFIDNHKIQLTKGGKAMKSKSRIEAGLDNVEVERTTIGSNTLKHYENWLRMVFYEEFENDEGTWQKVARVLQNFTSFKGMALNPLSAINNQMYGSIISNIEANAGQFFSKKDWLNATLEYTKNIPNFFAETGEGERFKHKQTAFVHYFNVMQDMDETAINDNQNPGVGNRVLQGMSWMASKAYALQHASEHNLQNRILFAMSYSHRLVDGKIVSFEEYKRGQMKPVHYKELTAEENKANLAYNKQKEKELRTEFDKAPNVFDAFDFTEGRLVAKEDVLPNEIAEFERKVLGVNQYLHGIYNKEDAGAMQQHALGRLAIQFRKWMRSGWNKRWGSRFGQSYWNERRNMKDEGYYMTTLRFFGTPIMDNWKAYWDKKGTDEAISALSAIGNVVKDIGRLFANFKVHYHTLDDNQRANVKRTLGEYFTFALLVAGLYLLKSIKGGDEEPDGALLLAIYQLDRTVTEMTTFVPVAAVPSYNPEKGVTAYVGGGWLNETKKILKSPTATFNSIESGLKISQYLLMYPFVDDEELTHQSGVYSGQNKLVTEIKKNIPMYNQYNRLLNLAKNYQYYKLF